MRVNKSAANRSVECAVPQPRTLRIAGPCVIRLQRCTLAVPPQTQESSLRAAPSVSQFHVGASRRRAAPGSQLLEGRRNANHGSRLHQRAHLFSFELWQPPVQHRWGGALIRHSAPVQLGLPRTSGTNRAMPYQQSQKPPSNLTLNRSANGTAPWPRGAVCTSSASRPGCCAVAARLASR